MWSEEGFKGFMRGNGINCLRIVPYRWVGGRLSSRMDKLILPQSPIVPSSLRHTNN